MSGRRPRGLWNRCGSPRILILAVVPVPGPFGAANVIDPRALRLSSHQRATGASVAHREVVDMSAVVGYDGSDVSAAAVRFAARSEDAWPGPRGTDRLGTNPLSTWGWAPVPSSIRGVGRGRPAGGCHSGRRCRPGGIGGDRDVGGRDGAGCSGPGRTRARRRSGHPRFAGSERSVRPPAGRRVPTGRRPPPVSGHRGARQPGRTTGRGGDRRVAAGRSRTRLRLRRGEQAPLVAAGGPRLGRVGDRIRCDAKHGPAGGILDDVRRPKPGSAQRCWPVTARGIPTWRWKSSCGGGLPHSC